MIVITIVLFKLKVRTFALVYLCPESAGRNNI